MYKHHYSPSLTQHCNELDIIPALTLCGTVSLGHSRACNHIQLTLYPKFFPSFTGLCMASHALASHICPLTHASGIDHARKHAGTHS